jgi:hypothetical protein
MRMRLFSPLLLIAVFQTSPTLAADADALLVEGSHLLRKAIDGDSASLVPAAKLFAKASALHQAAGNDEGARQANALLYWSKKRMTLVDIEAFQKGTDAVARASMARVTEKVPLSQARKYYQSAVDFARYKSNDQLLIAVRFFEVADRFAGTEVSLEAQRRSLDAMQKMNTKPAAAGPAEEEALPTGDIRNHASVKRLLTTFEKSVAAAKKPYISKLRSAEKYARSRAKLDEINQIKTEIASVSASNGPSTADIKNRSVAYAQKYYNTTVKRAQTRLDRDLASVLKAEIRTGNDDVAEAIVELRKSLAGGSSAAPTGAKPSKTASELVRKIKTQSLEEADWNAIRAKAHTIHARYQGGVDVGITCTPRAAYLIVPHPADTWSFGGNAGPKTYAGRLNNIFNQQNPHKTGALCYAIDSTNPGDFHAIIDDPIVKGKKGRLKLFTNDHQYGDNKGSIRVKIIRIE